MTQELLQDNLRVFVVPVEILDVPEISIYEKMAYTVLRSFANPREAVAFPSYATIARLGSMSRRQAIYAVQGLVEKGLLRKEMRYDVTKDRKIRNTSNKYYIERPVVQEMHHPSAQDAPPQCTTCTTPVQEMHHPSAPRAPKQHHLTDQFEQDQLTTTEESAVVVEKCLGKRIKLSDLNRWIQQYGREYVLAKAQYIAATKNKYRNVVGAFRKAIEENWDTEVFNEAAVTTEATKKRDERYRAFYDLFPDL